MFHGLDQGSSDSQFPFIDTCGWEHSRHCPSVQSLQILMSRCPPSENPRAVGIDKVRPLKRRDRSQRVCPLPHHSDRSATNFGASRPDSSKKDIIAAFDQYSSISHLANRSFARANPAVSVSIPSGFFPKSSAFHGCSLKKSSKIGRASC